MRIGWIGVHVEGLPALKALLERGVLEAVITLRPEQARRRSGGADYRPLCQRFGVPVHEVANINDADAVALLQSLALDLVFVIGWMQIVRPEVLRQARVGMIGAHASLLPADRGRAPINWALIHGAEKTGNTLFWLSDGVDAGDVIDQVEIPISPYDTCASLYRQVAGSTRQMVLRALPGLLEGRRPGRPQGTGTGVLLPRRRPEDGELDWARSSRDIYAMVRALTRPYPGAFTFRRQERLTIWQCALLPGPDGPPRFAGEVLGPVVSPVARACGQLIACGRGAVVVLEIERPDGARLRGPALSELPWRGEVLGASSRDQMTETA